MNRRLQKEMRVLAPYSIALIILGVIFWWEIPSTMETIFDQEGLFLRVIVLWGVPMGMFCLTTFMGVYLFGGEFADRTMERLLVQPVPRRQLWREKLLAMLLLVALVFLVELLICVVAAQMEEKSLLLFSGWDSLFLFFLFVFIGPAQALVIGPFMGLHLRQLHTAFWAALIAPMFLSFFWMLFFGLLSNLPLIWNPNWLADKDLSWFFWGGSIVALLLTYMAAYFLARRKFLRLEV